MAEVFRAKSFGVEGFERIVAVKRILPQMAEDEEFIKMFIDEARIASHLSHQNIVQIYELGRELDVYFISMEYVTGRDIRLLLDRFKRQRRLMSEPMACFIISRVCEALDYAHRKRDPAGKEYKIIHRDVSPQNVLASFEGEVKLCDFGIAKAATQSTRTQAGVLKGKFAYMSPEQVRGQPIDRRSDLFALGVIFFEMLTGERLFLGESDFSTLEAVRAARIPNPRQFNRELPERLEQILMKMLARNPGRRYQWASEVHEDLHEYLAKTGRIYHAHHLRQFMQEAYAREIQLENAKLEEFMRLKRPTRPRSDGHDDPGEANVVAQLRNGSLAPPRRTAPPVEEPSVATDVGQRPADDAFLPELAQTDGGAGIFSPERAQPPDSAPSPRVHDPAEAPDDDENATIMGEDLDAIVENDATVAEEGLAGPPSVRRESLSYEIQAAQAELLERLDAEGVLTDDETVDAIATDGEIDADKIPSVLTPPSKLSTLVGADEPNPYPLLADGETANETYVYPDDETSDATQNLLDEPVDWSAFGDSDDAPLNETRQDETVDRAPMRSGQPPGAGKRRHIRERKRSTMSGIQRPVTSAPQRPATPLASPVDRTPPPRIWASEVHSVAPPAGARVTGPRSLTDPKVLMGLAAVVSVMAMILLGVLFMRGRSTGASLQIQTTPTQAVQVALDGKIVAAATPIALESLPLGQHTIVLSSKGYQTYRQVFEIAEARPHTLTIPLEKLAEGQVDPNASAVIDPAPQPKSIRPPWDLRISSSPQGAAVTIDGRLEGTTPLTKQGIAADTSPEIVVELNGYEPFSQQVAPPTEPGGAATLKAKLVARPAPKPKIVERAPSDPAFERDKAPAPKAAPTPEPGSEPKPEPKPVAKVVPIVGPASSPTPKLAVKPDPEPKVAVTTPKPIPRPPVEPPPAAPPKLGKEMGFLLISTSPSGVPVVIDGEDTGLKTPVRRPHALSPGKHVVTLVGRSGRAQDFKVTISPGGTTKLVKRLR